MPTEKSIIVKSSAYEVTKPEVGERELETKYLKNE